MEDFITKTATLSNPWSGIRLSGLTVANCDKGIIAALPQDVIDGMELRTMPEPFHGNPDANVYLLGGNPLAGDDDLRYAQINDPVENYRNIYEKELCEELLGLNPDFIWLRKRRRSALPPRRTSLNPDFIWLRKPETVVDQNGIPYPAYKWWKQRLRRLRECLPQRLQCLLPSLVFAVELFPYHTKSVKDISSIPKLASDKYTDALICDAMALGKIIVVMRCREKWFSRIKELRDYPNLIVLNSPQSVYISPGNMPATDWAKLTDRIKLDAILLAIERGII